MPKIKFLSGSQSKLDAMTTSENGAFYLTDKNQLYIGRGSKPQLVAPDYKLTADSGKFVLSANGTVVSAVVDTANIHATANNSIEFVSSTGVTSDAQFKYLTVFLLDSVGDVTSTGDVAEGHFYIKPYTNVSKFAMKYRVYITCLTKQYYDPHTTAGRIQAANGTEVHDILTNNDEIRVLSISGTITYDNDYKSTKRAQHTQFVFPSQDFIFSSASNGLTGGSTSILNLRGYGDTRQNIRLSLAEWCSKLGVTCPEDLQYHDVYPYGQSRNSLEIYLDERPAAEESYLYRYMQAVECEKLVY